MVNVPVFQISVNINVDGDEATVLLGKADGSDPISRAEFELPKDLDHKPAMLMTAYFRDWKITRLALNKSQYRRKQNNSKMNK